MKQFLYAGVKRGCFEYISEQATRGYFHNTEMLPGA